ncbi:hypothetical protein LQG66_15150 [Bradyrhizobium ontarionense]|uniref:DUF3592 domain-containing protein n=1 Tax=Bradyrhizobium ontarionense TaxID=2898149 RepID=A0ABY3RL28_9BRAD|nr:hypothetical protein [Bradyrhizobium sp. A19]UFZ07556.1 hypothetical protein LQG66_15150 [Bradyrhizobium sp. A19]
MAEGSNPWWFNVFLAIEGWLVATPWILIIAGSVLIGAGVYFTVRPVQKTSSVQETSPSSTSETQQMAVPLLEEQSIYSGGGNNSLFAYSGKFARSGKLVRVYLQYARSPTDRPLIPVFEKHNFVKGEKLVVPLATYLDNSSQFRWGTEAVGFQLSESQSLGAPAKARVRIFDQDGNDIQQYEFVLWPTIWHIQVSIAQQHNMRTPRPEDLMSVPKIDSGNMRILPETWWDWK